MISYCLHSFTILTIIPAKKRFFTLFYNSVHILSYDLTIFSEVLVLLVQNFVLPAAESAATIRATTTLQCSQPVVRLAILMTKALTMKANVNKLSHLESDLFF